MAIDISSTFHEDDEPIDKIEAAWESGQKGRTARPDDPNESAAIVTSDAAQAMEPVQIATADHLGSIVVSGLIDGVTSPMRIPASPSGVKIGG